MRQTKPSDEINIKVASTEPGLSHNMCFSFAPFFTTLFQLKFYFCLMVCLKEQSERNSNCDMQI